MPTTLTLYTFGDSILDCGRYNDYGVHPGQLIVRNRDDLFPQFRGQDLESRRPARLDHRAADGAASQRLLGRRVACGLPASRSRCLRSAATIFSADWLPIRAPA